jgi:hypothetical protein
MVTTTITTLRSGREPEARRELAEVVLVGHPGKAGEDILEIGERVLAVALTTDDQGVEDGGALTGRRGGR